MANELNQLLDTMRARQEAADKTAAGPSDDAVARRAVLDALDQLGGLTVADDALTFEGTRFVLPEQMDGRIGDAIKYLRDYQKQQDTTYEYSREFRYRPWDGANAFQLAMMRLFGTTGIGAATQTFFGETPPAFATIDVAHNETAQVPWGTVHFEPLSADFHLGASMNAELGVLFSLSVEAPRRHRRRIDAFFQAVDRELEQHSIYRGKAITGADNPSFLNTSLVDPSKVVYSSDVMTQLDASLWSLLRYSDRMRELGMPLKRAVLLEGPYGTGKTLAGALTAQMAEAQGWTFILCRPGIDDLFGCLRTAQLYAPSVVQFEDVDVVAGQGAKRDVSAVLDALDGITSKGAEVMALFTTNNVEQLHRGVLRPGRLDAVIHIGALDRDGIERLIKVVVPERMLGAVDYDRVHEAFAGYLPAFAREAIDRALRYALVRTGGGGDEIDTQDLVDAAQGLRRQLDLMTGAGDVPVTNTLGEAVGEVVESEITKLLNNTALMRDGQSMGKLAVANGKR
jgi:AAA+ superfamily predicted ATPase